MSDYFDGSVVGFAVEEVAGDSVAFAPFPHCVGGFAEGFGDFVGGGVVGEFHSGGLWWVDVVA